MEDLTVLRDLLDVFAIGVAVAFARIEMDCEDGEDNDGDGDIDCEDDHCVLADCCAGLDCDDDETCCADGCCNVDDDAQCCGACHVECEDDQTCCDGACAECCDDPECDDSNPCTVDYCDTGVCVNNASGMDTAACPGGICCGGECRLGGECCTDAQCGCRGFATACDDVTDGGECLLQTGCSWDDQSCVALESFDCSDINPEGFWLDVCDSDCTNCGMIAVSGSPPMCMPISSDPSCQPAETCEDQTNLGDCTVLFPCNWTAGECTGPPNCDGIDSYSCMLIGDMCLHIPGAGECSGTHAPCATHTDLTCSDQQGCAWQPTCTGSYLCT